MLNNTKNNRILQNPSEMGKRKKGMKYNKTLIKEKINYELAKQTIWNNIMEFLMSDNEKLRFEATCRLAEYIIPRKTKTEIETVTEINLIANPKLIRDKED